MTIKRCAECERIERQARMAENEKAVTDATPPGTRVRTVKMAYFYQVVRPGTVGEVVRVTPGTTTRAPWDVTMNVEIGGLPFTIILPSTDLEVVTEL